jgi:glycerate kinase
MNRFLLAPNSFKGTLSAVEVCDILEAALLCHIPDASIEKQPMADGGDGMTDVLLRIIGGQKCSAVVTGPEGIPVIAEYAVLTDGSAVLEMAEAAGMKKMTGAANPLYTTTAGVGELLLLFKASGIKHVILGLGGSATNDAGIGMAYALGWRFLGTDDHQVEPFAAHLGRIERIIPPESSLGMDITVACDVCAPLCGDSGATAIFGPQKGVTDNLYPILEEGICHFADVLAGWSGMDIALVPGAGAAGGLGAAVMALLGGRLVSGIELVLRMSRFDQLLAKTDMVLTGEGCLDGQSAQDKATVGIARAARNADIPCVALCGTLGDGAERMYHQGLTAMFAASGTYTNDIEMRERCRADYARLADAFARLMAGIKGVDHRHGENYSKGVEQNEDDHHS